MDKKKEIMKALQHMSVQTGSLACLGCGYEHNCGLHGCAVLKQAMNLIEELSEPWISVKDRLPEDERDGETVMAVISGKPHEKITLDHALMTAGYFNGEGWLVDRYPAWENPTVTHWMPLPEPPEEKQND